MVNRFSGLTDNMSEGEIRQRLSTFISDELRAEFLENCLRKKLGDSVRKNVHIALAQIYEKKRWYGNASRNITSALLCTNIYREKIELNMKLGKLNLLDDKHILSRDAFKMAMDIANSEEKEKLSNEVKNIYLNGAKSLEEKGKLSRAVSIYEYSLDLLNEDERIKAKQRLMILYEKLGRIKDFMRLKRELM